MSEINRTAQEGLSERIERAEAAAAEELRTVPPSTIVEAHRVVAGAYERMHGGADVQKEPTAEQAPEPYRISEYGAPLERLGPDDPRNNWKK